MLAGVEQAKTYFDCNMPAPVVVSRADLKPHVIRPTAKGRPKCRPLSLMAVVPGVAIPLDLIITRFVDFIGGGVGNGGKK